MKKILFLALFLLNPLILKSAQSCPPGYQYNVNVGCYICKGDELNLFPESMSWIPLAADPFCYNGVLQLQSKQVRGGTRKLR